METEITSQAVGLSSTDFSIIKLFVRADIIVKSVIIILIASFSTTGNISSGMECHEIIPITTINSKNKFTTRGFLIE